MGIEGLKFYVSSNSEKFLETVYLSDKSLIIDADCLIHENYGRRLDRAYINKYADFEKKVSKFLDDLLDCKITPIIVFKGGKEVENLTKDNKNLEESVCKVELGIEKKKVTQLPILLDEIVKCVAKAKSVTYVQSLFRSEYDIVSIAKILDSPVLSNVNNYYLNNVSFIPFSKVMKKVKIGSKFAFQCKRYTIENILKFFPDQRTVAIAKIVMNNHYRKKIFNNFYCLLPLDMEVKSRSERRILAVLSWFQAHHTLNDAINEILKTVKPEFHADLIKIFENSVYEHENLSPRLLKPVGISEEVINEIILDLKSMTTQYKYETLEIFDFSNENCGNLLEFKDKRFKITRVCNKSALAWFIDEFNAGRYPTYFIDIYSRNLYIPPVQMENLSYKSSVNISLRIIGVIFKILVEESEFYNLLYVTRGSETDIEIFELNPKEMNYDFEIPSLEVLRCIPISSRKKIFFKTLEIAGDNLDDCPSEWALFISAIVYWFKNAESIFTEPCHVYSLIFTMIYSIVEKKISKKNSLTSKYFDLVTEVDCKTAKQILDSTLKTKTYFDINKIHAFSLFENCLMHIIHFNALLDYPYPNINIAELFNGKTVDQLYHSLKNKRYPLEDMKTILKKSPSFLTVFETTLSKFEAMV